MKKYLIGLCLTLVMFVLPAFSLTVQAANTEIHQGIYIGTNDVSGMTQNEADKVIKAFVESAKTAQITLVCVDDNTVTVTPEDLGMVWKNPDVVREAVAVGKSGNVVQRFKQIADLKKSSLVLPLVFDFDKELVNTLLKEKCDSFNVEAVNVGLKRIENGFQIEKGQKGQVLDDKAAFDTIIKTFGSEWDGKDTVITLPVIIDEPLGNEDELSQVKDIIGTFTTSYRTSGADRSANVANGCNLVNGTTLYPGETFSMYDTIKPFSVENGYHMAGSYLNGMVVDSLGGGICQVSTTLYNAVLRAELEIVERNNHSMIVSYVPASADAAIAESSGKDFKFINNTDTPIYIEGITTTDKHVIFNIYGKETRPANRQVTYQSQVLETTNPTTENIVQTTAQPLGFTQIQSAHIGYKAKLMKIVTVDGVEQSREEVNRSTYKMVPRTITVGVSTENADAYNQMQQAIATGSIDQVKAVADYWAAQAAAAQAAQNAPAPEQEQPPEPQQ